jgi:glycosyltransferase involved in cell wall biosynthesis
MKILFISHYFYPEGNAPANRVYEMARRWARAGHDVTIVTAVPNVPAGVIYDGYRNHWRQEESIEGMTVVRMWTYVTPNAGKFRRIASYVSFMITAFIAALRVQRPDVVIATSPQFFCGWAGRLTSAVRRLPFILEIRDLWPESIVAVGAMRSSPLIRFLHWLEKRLYAGADHIVTVGTSYRDQLLLRGVDESQLAVIPNGVDLETFSSVKATDRIRNEFGLGDRFVCAYIGTIGMASGLETVIRAGELLQDSGRDDIRFLLVGDGADREKLVRLLGERNIRNVVMTGRLPKERVPEVIASVDACLVHLLKRDLFRTVIPSKIFEAGAMQKPIILGVEGFAAQLLGEAGAGICIEPENEAELIEAVTRLAGRPDEARAMGKAGRALVSRSFNYDLLAEEYVARIEEVLHGG